MSNISDVAIIGSGPAGLTAAIYTARANLKPTVFAGLNFGGQLMNTTEVENFPGFPEGIMGPDLMMKFVEQAKKFGTEMIYENVIKVDFSSKIKKIFTAKAEYEFRSVIIATGANPKKLGLQSEEKYWSKGVSSCATCDGAFYKQKLVAVVGGGDSACEEADFLTRFATKVYLLVRKSEMKASKIMQQRVIDNPKIEILWNTEIEEILGNEQYVTGLKILDNKNNTSRTIDLDGLFLAIGHIPNSGFLGESLDIDNEGYIVAKDNTHTKVDGVFVAGDVYDHHYRQAITAAGFGCMAALDTERWLASQ
jgi:thioredoxin reductase (NADPH)